MEHLIYNLNHTITLFGIALFLGILQWVSNVASKKAMISTSHGDKLALSTKRGREFTYISF